MNKFRQWALNIFCWDGVLPLVVCVAPLVVKLLFPARQGVSELTFIVIPVMAFMIRYVHGRKYRRPGEFLIWQTVLFFVAIFLLFVLDAALAMMHLVQNGAPLDAWATWGALYGVYLLIMAVAIYPTRVQFAD